MHSVRRVALARNASLCRYNSTVVVTPTAPAQPPPRSSSSDAKKAVPKKSSSEVKQAKVSRKQITINPFYKTGKIQQLSPAELLKRKKLRKQAQAAAIPRPRPQISNYSPKDWNRPVPKGVIPAYDLALKLIKEDSAAINAEAGALEKEILELEAPMFKAQATVDKLLSEGKGEENAVVLQSRQVIEEIKPKSDALREKLGVLRIQQRVNEPRVRWRVDNAMVNMKNLVDRYLLEQRWRKEGDLDLLMERIHQMHVVPDILPTLHPSLDLQVVYRTPASTLLRSLPNAERTSSFVRPNAPDEKEVVVSSNAQPSWNPQVFLPSLPEDKRAEQRKEGEASVHQVWDNYKNKNMVAESIHKRRKVQMLVEPGAFLDSRQTQVAPRLFTRVFHPDTRLYTLIMIDYDVPDPENQTYTSFLHWLQPNIPLSATSPGYNTRLRIPTNVHVPYIPPHPQKGTSYHRYTIMLLPQPSLDGMPYPSNTFVQEKLDARRPRPLLSSLVPTSAEINVPRITDEERRGFNVREFIQKYGLDPALGGGAHMFRGSWDEWVSKVLYPRVLKTPEPVYGRPPRFDPVKAIQDEKKGSRYFGKAEEL